MLILKKAQPVVPPVAEKHGAGELIVPRDCVARNRGADFVQCHVPPRSARRNKALDPTARAGCDQACGLLPFVVLAGQRRDWLMAGMFTIVLQKIL